MDDDKRPQIEKLIQSIAWLRTGPDSVISHDSALSVYELSDALPGEIHVIIPRTASRRHRGLRLHTHRIQPDDFTRRSAQDASVR